MGDCSIQSMKECWLAVEGAEQSKAKQKIDRRNWIRGGGGEEREEKLSFPGTWLRSTSQADRVLVLALADSGLAHWWCLAGKRKGAKIGQEGQDGMEGIGDNEQNGTFLRPPATTILLRAVSRNSSQEEGNVARPPLVSVGVCHDHPVPVLSSAGVSERASRLRMLGGGRPVVLRARESRRPCTGLDWTVHTCHTVLGRLIPNQDPVSGSQFSSCPSGLSVVLQGSATKRPQPNEWWCSIVGERTATPLNTTAAVPPRMEMNIVKQLFRRVADPRVLHNLHSLHKILRISRIGFRTGYRTPAEAEVRENETNTSIEHYCIYALQSRLNFLHSDLRCRSLGERRVLQDSPLMRMRLLDQRAAGAESG
jgi:hypothetical protein